MVQVLRDGRSWWRRQESNPRRLKMLTGGWRATFVANAWKFVALLSIRCDLECSAPSLGDMLETELPTPLSRNILPSSSRQSVALVSRRLLHRLIA